MDKNKEKKITQLWIVKIRDLGFSFYGGHTYSTGVTVRKFYRHILGAKLEERTHHVYQYGEDIDDCVRRSVISTRMWFVGDKCFKTLREALRIIE